MNLSRTRLHPSLLAAGIISLLFLASITMALCQPKDALVPCSPGSPRGQSLKSEFSFSSPRLIQFSRTDPGETGTLVVTADGLVPIETIEPGDIVLSRDESSHRMDWKAVRDTFLTRPDRLLTIYFSSEDDAAGDDTLTGTASHPFWVVEREAFLPMEKLEPQMSLYTSDGRTLTIARIEQERAPPGQSFTTYNFEVEDFHTYFVGESGVWVHNAGRVCDDAFSTWHRLFEKHDDVAVSYQQLARIQNRKNIPHNLRNQTLWGLIDDELPKLHQKGKLSQRIVDLGSEQGGVFNRPKEALSAVRFEKKSGRTFRRPTQAEIDPTNGEQLGSFDFIDDAGKKWDVVGPTQLGNTPDLKIQELINAIRVHFDNPGKGNPLIDLGGLAPDQQRRIMEKVGRMDWKGKSPDWLLE